MRSSRSAWRRLTHKLRGGCRSSCSTRARVSLKAPWQLPPAELSKHRCSSCQVSQLHMERQTLILDRNGIETWVLSVVRIVLLSRWSNGRSQYHLTKPYITRYCVQGRWRSEHQRGRPTCVSRWRPCCSKVKLRSVGASRHPLEAASNCRRHQSGRGSDCRRKEAVNLGPDLRSRSGNVRCPGKIGEHSCHSRLRGCWRILRQFPQVPRNAPGRQT